MKKILTAFLATTLIVSTSFSCENIQVRLNDDTYLTAAGVLAPRSGDSMGIEEISNLQLELREAGSNGYLQVGDSSRQLTHLIDVLGTSRAGDNILWTTYAVKEAGFGAPSKIVKVISNEGALEGQDSQSSLPGTVVIEFSDLEESSFFEGLYIASCNKYLN